MDFVKIKENKTELKNSTDSLEQTLKIVKTGSVKQIV